MERSGIRWTEQMAEAILPPVAFRAASASKRLQQGRRAMNLPVDSLTGDIVGNAFGLWVGLAI